MPPMNCRQFEQHLDLLLDGRSPLPSPGRLDGAALEHTARCAQCTRLLERYRLLDQSIAAWKGSSPPVDLSDAVLAKLAFQSPNTLQPNSRRAVVRDPIESSARLRRLTPSAAAALMALSALALVLFVALFGFSDRPGGGELTDAPTAMEDRQSSEVTHIDDDEHDVRVAEEEFEADLDSLLQEAGLAYWNLANQATDSATGVTLWMQPTDADQPPNTVPRQTDPAVFTWLREIAGGLEPVRDQFGSAWRKLWETMPAEPVPAT